MYSRSTKLASPRPVVRRVSWLSTVLLVALLPGCTSAPPVEPAVTSTVVPPPVPVPPQPTLAERLARAAPEADPGVLALAVQAQQCAVGSGTVDPVQRLAVIDYSRPSTEPRLWVFALADARLLYVEHVAHGKHSGANLATEFSNIEGSLQSSLGLFSTAETYIGGHGYSLRMDGLEPGINDHARERLIVIHGADYVDPAQALRQGRLGRSFGCPAVRSGVVREVIDSLKGGQLLFAYYPDMQWLKGSRFLGCAGEGEPDGAIASVASKAGDRFSRNREQGSSRIEGNR
ncbi:murein L,D-transpeptidase catalytic domain family protein [Lysobacter sp. A421]